MFYVQETPPCTNQNNDHKIKSRYPKQTKKKKKRTIKKKKSDNVCPCIQICPAKSTQPQTSPLRLQESSNKNTEESVTTLHKYI